MTAKPDCSTRPPAYEALARENAMLRAEVARLKNEAFSALVSFDKVLEGYAQIVARLQAELNEAGLEVAKLSGELYAVRYLAETDRAARELAESRVNALLTERLGYAVVVEVPPAPVEPVEQVAVALRNAVEQVAVAQRNAVEQVEPVEQVAVAQRNAVEPVEPVEQVAVTQRAARRVAYAQGGGSGWGVTVFPRPLYLLPDGKRPQRAARLTVPVYRRRMRSSAFRQGGR